MTLPFADPEAARAAILDALVESLKRELEESRAHNRELEAHLRAGSDYITKLENELREIRGSLSS